MKKFSQINEVNESEKLNIQKDTINFIKADQLKDYLKIADKFLSAETKEIINWLIVNNDTYIDDLDPSGKADNALAAFYDKGIPKKEDLAELYKCIGKIKQADRLLEIPVFLTKKQFEDIINKKVSPDEILLDFTSKKGREKIIEKYTPLIHKIINQWIGKSNLGPDDLLSVAYEGITYAMNSYGKHKVRGENGKWVEVENDEKITGYSFMQYASYCIVNSIREEIKHKSHIVRVPASQQTKERKEKGFNTKTYAVSGEKQVGKDSSGNNKTLFDYIDSGENGYKGVDSEDLEKLWKYVYTKLDDNFKKRDLEIFYSLFGINGYKQIKGKELATKFNIVPSAITPIKLKIIKFIRSDKKLFDAFNEILSIVGEAKQDKYNEEDQYLEEHSIRKLNKNMDND